MVRSPMVAAGIYIDETLQHRGCPLCYLGAMDVLCYQWYLLSERVTSPTTHDKLESSWGFGNLHAWLVQEMNQRLNQDGMSTAELTPAAECPACVVRRDGERAAISALVEFLRDQQDIRAQYQ
jgi:hypothetical protein